MAFPYQLLSPPPPPPPPAWCQPPPAWYQPPPPQSKWYQPPQQPLTQPSHEALAIGIGVGILGFVFLACVVWYVVNLKREATRRPRRYPDQLPPSSSSSSSPSPETLWCPPCPATRPMPCCPHCVAHLTPSAPPLQGNELVCEFLHTDAQEQQNW